MMTWRSLNLVLTSLVLLAVAEVASSQTIETNSNNPNDITVTVNVSESDYRFETVRDGVELKSVVYFNEPSARNQSGAPALPLLRMFVAVGNTDYMLEEVDEERSSHLSPPAPMAGEPEPTLEGEAPVFKGVDDLFSRSMDTVSMGEKFYLGKLAVIPVAVRPFHYESSTGKVKLRQNITFSLTSKRPVEEFDFRGHVNRLDRRQIRHLVVNSEEALNGLSLTQVNDGSLMIITTADYSAAADLLNGYYSDRGEQSFIHYIESAKSSVSSVKAAIKTAYEERSVQSVMFLGNESVIPLGSMSSTPGDTTYSLMDNDSYIDVAIGRLPASSPEQAEHLVNKTIYYQNLAKMGYANKKAILSAHKEQYPGKYTANMERVRRGPNDRGLEFIPVYGGNGGKNRDIVEMINDGVGIVNYRGHGSYQAWTGWANDGSFSKSDIRDLTNTDENLAVVFNIACYNGGIQQNSLALVEDQLFHKVDGNDNSGVVATLGATLPSYTTVNHDYAEYIFKLIGELDSPEMGSINVLANNALTRDRNGSMNKNTKMYVLFSDPNLRIAVGEKTAQ